MSVWKALSLILSGLLILPLALAGCATTEVSAREIAANVILAYPKVDSYKMDINISSVLIQNSNFVETQAKITGNSTISIDVPSKKMQYTLDMMADIPGESKKNIGQNMYISDGYLYMNTSGTGVDGWKKMAFSDDLWGSEDQLKQQVDFLQKATDMTFAGEETVEGVDCYILDVKPDMASILDWVQSQQKDLFSESNSSQKNLADMIKWVSIKEWVSKDSSLPVKSDIQMTMQINDPGTAAGSSRATVRMDAQAKYYNYNEPVTIELPQEALDAQSISLP